MDRSGAAMMALLLLAGCGDNAPDGDAPGGSNASVTMPSAQDAGLDAAASDGADGGGPAEVVAGSPSPIDETLDPADQPRPQAEPVIAQPFRGRWAETLADCRAEPGEARIVIGPSEVQFAHANGDPLAVTQLGDRQLAVRLRVVEKGMISERVDQMMIDPDGISLRYRIGNRWIDLKRCPV